MDESKKDMISKIPDIAIKWIGSITSLWIHTIVFIVCFLLPLFGIIEWTQMLLVLTTIVSLEAIYLSIFIQMSVNRGNQFMEIIQEDVEEMSDHIDDIGEDIDDLKDEDIGEERKESDVLISIEEALIQLQSEINRLKKNKKNK